MSKKNHYHILHEFQTIFTRDQSRKRKYKLFMWLLTGHKGKALTEALFKYINNVQKLCRTNIT